MGQLLYEGKAKRILATQDEDIVLVDFKDSATAFNGEKKSEIQGKGQLNNEISTLIFKELENQGIESHFIQKVSKTGQLVKRVSIIPLEVVVRNIAAGSMAKRLGIEEGRALRKPIVEFYLKDDSLGDPIILEDHILELGIASLDEIDSLKEMAFKINGILIEFFKGLGIKLIDFKLEFGKDSKGRVILADEISPDTCRLWDIVTNEKMDKDVFRRDLGSITDAYGKILARMGGLAW